MKNRVRQFLVLAALFSGTAGAASAQDARLASQALRCSMVMHFLGQAQADNPDLARRLDWAASTFAGVHLKQSGKPVHPGERVTEDLLRSVQDPSPDSMTANPASFREEAVACGAWADGFSVQGPNYRYVPVFPKVVAPQTRQLYQALAEQRLRQSAQSGPH